MLFTRRYELLASDESQGSRTSTGTGPDFLPLKLFDSPSTPYSLL